MSYKCFGFIFHIAYLSINRKIQYLIALGYLNRSKMNIKKRKRDLFSN